jgi:hypothetical protein
VNRLLSAATLTAALFSPALAHEAAAQAQNIPPGGFVTGYVDGVGTSTEFTVNMEAGKDYWVGTSAEWWNLKTELLDPGGRVLRTWGPLDYGWGGTEFRPTATATYRLRTTQTGPLNLQEPAYVVGKYGPDCRGGTATRCTLTLGQAKVGRWDFRTDTEGDEEFGVSEWDYYRVRLTAGRTYTVTLASAFNSPMRVSVHNASNRELTAAGAILYPDVNSVSIRFRPSTTGDYWIRAAGSYAEQNYSVTVR